MIYLYKLIINIQKRNFRPRGFIYENITVWDELLQLHKKHQICIGGFGA